MVTEASAEMLQKLLLSERKIILCWIVVKKINGFILVLRFRQCYYMFLHLQQEADERKAQKRVREAVQKENSEAAGKAHESYVIQPGDTLFQISMDRYGSIEAISQICKLNGMSADEIIYPGQVIVLP